MLQIDRWTDWELVVFGVNWLEVRRSSKFHVFRINHVFFPLFLFFFFLDVSLLEWFRINPWRALSLTLVRPNYSAVVFTLNKLIIYILIRKPMINIFFSLMRSVWLTMHVFVWHYCHLSSTLLFVFIYNDFDLLVVIVA